MQNLLDVMLWRNPIAENNDINNNLLKPTDHFTYHQVQHSKILHADYFSFMCFVWLSEQTVTFALYIINRLVFITEVESVYCAVRNESLYNTETSCP